jgi:hypothetical protein
MSLLILSFIFAANAADKGLPLPTVGSTVVVTDCATKLVSAPWNAANTAKVVIGNARAQQICSEAKGDLAIADARAQAIKAQADAEAGLVQAAAIPVMNGDSVSYDRQADGSVHLATGPAGTVHELAAVAAALDPQLTGDGQYGAYNADPNLVGLARLSGIPLGVSTPAAAPATAACGTADECQKRVAALQAALAKK